MTVVARRNITEIETYSGRFVDLLDPQPDQISITDIAVHLSNIVRFGGGVSRFYSVAEHSVRCAELASDAALKMACLLHDAHEAYTLDLPAPLKRVLDIEAPGVVAALQSRLDGAIGEALGVWYGDFKHPIVKSIDDYIMYREAAGLKYSHGIGPHWANDTYYEPMVAYGWSPPEAEGRFITCYEQLSSALKA